MSNGNIGGYFVRIPGPGGCGYVLDPNDGAVHSTLSRIPIPDTARDHLGPYASIMEYHGYLQDRGLGEGEIQGQIQEIIDDIADRTGVEPDLRDAVPMPRAAGPGVRAWGFSRRRGIMTPDEAEAYRRELVARRNGGQRGGGSHRHEEQNGGPSPTTLHNWEVYERQLRNESPQFRDLVLDDDHEFAEWWTRRNPHEVTSYSARTRQRRGNNRRENWDA